MYVFDKYIVVILIHLLYFCGCQINTYIFIMEIIPIIALIITIIKVYLLGKGWGIFAVSLAFIGGLLIIKIPLLGIILVFIGLIIGYAVFPS